MADFPVGSDVPVDTLDTQVLSTASTIGLSPLLNKLLALGRALIAKVGTGASTPVANSVFVGNGTGTSAWLAGLTSAYIGPNAVTQRAGTASFAGTRTTATYADVDSTNGKVTFTTTGGDLLVLFFGSAANTSAGVVQHIALRLDSGAEVSPIPVYSYTGLATFPVTFCTAALFTGVSAASHSVFARHINDSATGTMTTTGFMIGVELKK